jgi:predicted permease
MSTTTTGGRIASAVIQPGPARALGVAGAAAAAMAVWAIAVPGLGIHLIIRFGSGSPQTVHAGLVVGAALAASLCGWALLAVLERRTRHARAIWTTAAVAVTAASLSLPLVAGITTATVSALALMHLAVAAVLIPALSRSAAGQGATS